MKRIQYLTDWAVKYYHRGRYDLATSGVPFDQDVLPTPTSGRAVGTGMPAVLAAQEAVAASYGARPDEITLAIGASGALFLAAAGFSESAAVAVESPVYEPLWRGCESFGVPVRFVQRRAEEGYGCAALADAAGAIEGCEALFLTNPHNPTGVYDDPAALARLAEAIAPAWLIVDEVYLPFVPGGQSAWGVADNVCVISSLTKAYGYGLLRFGWLVAPAALTRRLRDAAIYTYGRYPSLTASVAVDVLADVDAIHARATRHLAGRLAHVDRAIAAHPRMSWSRPADGMIIGLVELHGIADDLAFARAFMEAHDATLAPGSFFRAPGTIRLGLGAQPDRFDEAFQELLAFAAAWPTV